MDDSLKTQDFDYVRSLAHRHSGLCLIDAQAYLVTSRLSLLAKECRLDDVPSLIAASRAQPAGELEQLLVEAMATHETFFFRDLKTFNYIRDVIVSRLHAARPAGHPLHIWSAACSTGQEAYSLLMLIDEARAQHAPDAYRITATDFSVAALSRAEQGIYDEFEVHRGLTDAQQATYFDPHPHGMQVKSSHRRRIKFARLNLLDSFSRLAPVDILMCRNVLIYFDDATRRNVVGRLHEVLAPDGYLVLGNSETTLHLANTFVAAEPDRVSILRKATSPKISAAARMSR